MSRRSRILRWAIPLAVVPVLVLLGYGFRTDPREIPSPLVGKPASPFTLTAFDGKPLSLEALRGQVVIVNFWASWCIPCRDEAPVVEGIWRRVAARGAVVLGLDTQDVTSDALSFMRRYRMSYPSVRDGTDASQRDWELTGVPETFLIDRRGRIALHITGPIGSDQEGEVVKRVEALL